MHYYNEHIAYNVLFCRFFALEYAADVRIGLIG